AGRVGGAAALRAGAGRGQLHLRGAGRPGAGPAQALATSRRVEGAVRADDGGCGDRGGADDAAARALIAVARRLIRPALVCMRPGGEAASRMPDSGGAPRLRRGVPASTSSAAAPGPT